MSTPPTPTPPAVTDPRPTATGTQHRSSAAPGTPAGGGRRVTGSGGGPLHPRAHHAARRALATGGSGLLSTTPPGYLGPRSWTGSAANDPALLQALGDLSNLLRNGDTPPRFLIPIYMAAGRRFHIPWQVLAGINAVESDYGRDLNTSTAGAIGWMQFEPGTWKEYGMAVDGHSVANPYDPVDAIFSAARYLAAAGGAQDISRAIYAYNHATWYVNMVLARARAIGDRIHPHTHTGRRGMIHVYFAFARRHWRAHYHSGWLSHYDRLIAAANMVSAANFPYLYGGGHEQPARFGPFDCSGSVSYVMQQAGYRVPTTVSGEIPIWKFPAGPGRVTIFYNAGHTFMRIGSRYFGTSGFARPGGGAGWFSTDKLPVGYLANFREVHVPRLGVDSFAPSRPGRAGRPGTPGQATDSAHRAKRAHGTGPSAGVTLTPFVSTNAYTLRVLAPLA